jgi:hypothetical protein
VISEKCMWAGGKWTTGMEREGFSCRHCQSSFEAHIEDAEQTPLTEFRLEGSTTVCPMEPGKMSDLARCNTRCTLQVVLSVFEPLLFRGVGYRQQPIHVS